MNEDERRVARARSYIEESCSWQSEIGHVQSSLGCCSRSARLQGQAGVAPVPEQGTGELEQAEVVAGLLVPTDQDRAALREPCQSTFHHPPARPVRLRGGRPLVA